MKSHYSRVAGTALAIVAVAAALAFTSLPPRQVLAEASTDNNGVYSEIAALQAAVGQLQSDFIDAQVELAVTAEALANAQSDLADAQSDLAEAKTELGEALTTIEELVQAQQTTNEALVAVAGTLQFVSVQDGEINGLSGPHLIIQGCNVHVRSGGGATDDFETGRGNLIVGYNELVGSNEHSVMAGSRLGSHNLVVGPGHTYASAGGLVAGDNNSLLARHASVTGGFRNSAVAYASSITGGKLNATLADYASVSGGDNNRASGEFSSVSGGGDNVALGQGSAISGGSKNNAFGKASVVSGGLENTVFNLGEAATVSGGYQQDAHVNGEHVP